MFINHNGDMYQFGVDYALISDLLYFVSIDVHIVKKLILSLDCAAIISAFANLMAAAGRNFGSSRVVFTIPAPSLLQTYRAACEMATLCDGVELPGQWG